MTGIKILIYYIMKTKYLIALIMLIVVIVNCCCYFSYSVFGNYWNSVFKKCHNCHDTNITKKVYRGGGTKCFDCEKQLTPLYNGKRANFGHSTKCFDCEQQMNG